MFEPYLVGLNLRGRKVVVVGGGSVAQRRLGLLASTGADIHVVTREATPAIEAMGLITLTIKEYEHSDLDGAWYTIACTDEPETNAQIVADANSRHIFCVRADLAKDGTAATPATVTHDGLVVGVLGHGDHRRSAAVRSAIHDALTSGAIDDHSRTAPVVPSSDSDVETDDTSIAKRGHVALVGGGPGAADLITVRGRRLLARADVVVADRLAPPELLAELGPEVEVIDAAKIPYGRFMAQESINDILVTRARAGKFVVRLKGGDPFVYGRGYEEVQACVAAGVPVFVVPGVTSAISVPSAAGIPVTHRGVTHEVVIVSGHLAPEHPDSLVDWPALARLRGTIVLMMAVERLAEFASALIAGGRDTRTPVAVIEDGTMRTQRITTGPLDGIAKIAAASDVRPPAIIVIGDVAGFDALNGQPSQR